MSDKKIYKFVLSNDISTFFWPENDNGAPFRPEQVQRDSHEVYLVLEDEEKIFAGELLEGTKADDAFSQIGQMLMTADRKLKLSQI